MGIALLIVGNRFDQLVISDLDPRRDRGQERHINVRSVNSQETMKHNPANVIRGADCFGLEQNDWISSVQLDESAGSLRLRPVGGVKSLVDCAWPIRS